MAAVPSSTHAALKAVNAWRFNPAIAGTLLVVGRIAPIPRFEEFQTVMKSGILASSPHFALHALAHNAPILHKKAAAGDLRLGALLPKRFAKRAVTRNLLRRQIYATGATCLPQLQAAALQATEPQCLDVVLRLRKVFALSEFPSASSQQLKTAARSELNILFNAASSRLQSGSRTAQIQPSASISI